MYDNTICVFSIIGDDIELHFLHIVISFNSKAVKNVISYLSKVCENAKQFPLFTSICLLKKCRIWFHKLSSYYVHNFKGKVLINLHSLYFSGTIGFHNHE